MADNQVCDTQPGNPRVNVLIVDFDFVMVDGYEILNLAAENALGAHNVELTRTTFLRKLLGSRAMPALASLLPQGADITPEKFVAQVYDNADKTVDGAAFRRSMLDLIRKADSKGVKLIFVTARNQTIIEQKLEGAGIREPRVIRVDKGEIFGEYHHDAWNKAVRVAYPINGSCLLLLGGAQSVKDALALGRRAVSTVDAEGECVVFPSILVSHVVAVVPPLVAYQDYTGADYLFDVYPEAELAKSLSELVFY